MQKSRSLRAIAATICLLIPSIAVLIVPYFNRLEPQLFGVPYFYGYQMVWVVLATLFLTAAYFLFRPLESEE